MNNKLTEAIFTAESVAHLRGYTWEILPVTDAITQMSRAIDAYLDPSVDKEISHKMLVDASISEGIRFE
jgi:hypothetical protein